MRASQDLKAIKTLSQECWAVSDSRQAFAQALEERGSPFFTETGDARRSRATGLIRGLVDRVVLRPEDSASGVRLAIDLQGELAGILRLAAKGGKPSGQGLKTQLIDFVEEINLVAGGALVL